jgi:hypothetical protein
VCPGGVCPARFVGAGDAGELLADGEALGVGEGSADGDGEPGSPGCTGAEDGLPVRPPRWWSLPVPPCCALAAPGAGGAAQCVKGAWGPPARATTTADRQAARTTPDPTPRRRMIRWRRPDGSVNTGLDSTRKECSETAPGTPGNAEFVDQQADPDGYSCRGAGRRSTRQARSVGSKRLASPGSPGRGRPWAGRCSRRARARTAARPIRSASALRCRSATRACMISRWMECIRSP